MRSLEASRASLIVAIAASLAACAPTLKVEKDYGTAGIIRKVKLTEDAVCPGEQVRVVVETQHPTDPHIPVYVWVDGRAGAPHYLQWNKPGLRQVRVYALTEDHREDQREETIQVKTCDPRTYARLYAQQNPYHPHRVDFVLAEHPPRGRGREGLAPKGKARYVWQFGDGTTQTTDEAFASHDYKGVMTHTRRFSTFQVQVKDKETPYTVYATVSPASSFYHARSKGIILVDANVSTSDPEPGKDLHASLLLRSYHDEPIVFDKFFVQYQYCDPTTTSGWNAVDATKFFSANQLQLVPPGPGDKPTVSATDEQGALSPGWKAKLMIQGQASVDSRVRVPATQIPAEVCVYGFHLVGMTPSRIPSYASFYVRARANEALRSRVMDTTTAQTLEALVTKGLVPSDRKITTEELHLLEQRGIVEKTPQGWRMKP